MANGSSGTGVAKGGLRLRDFRPRQRLRVPETRVERPAMAAIDAHNHLGPTPFSGRWATASAVELADALDASSIAAIVDLDGGQGDGLRRELDRWAPLRDRVAVFAGLDYPMWGERHDFGEEEARRLRAGVAAGARGLKAWKPLGLTARDPSGRIVAVDDARLVPLWAAAGELGLPVTIHVADPIAFFDPLDATNERYEELLEHPDWHFWPTRPPGRPDLPGFPPFDEIIDGLEALVARHPGTTFVGAHVGCVPEDLARVAAMLRAYPNWNVDIAARIAELGRQPYSARDLVTRFPDRVLFGTDAPPDPAWWAVHARFLETRDESFAYEPEEGDDAGAAPRASRPPPRRVAGPLAHPRPGAPGGGPAPRLCGQRPAPALPRPAGGRRRPRDPPPHPGGPLGGVARRAGPRGAVHARPGFETDGFVHCTDGDAEMVAVANRFLRRGPRRVRGAGPRPRPGRGPVALRRPGAHLPARLRPACAATRCEGSARPPGRGGPLRRLGERRAP